MPAQVFNKTEESEMTQNRRNFPVDAAVCVFQHETVSDVTWKRTGLTLAALTTGRSGQKHFSANNHAPPHKSHPFCRNSDQYCFCLL